MNAIKNKIRSRRGASLTFALLIFLVCAVVSIVVIIAGTAAAGRMSQRANTDQRYYAVTSAVELLCDDFKDMVVTVEYSKPVSATSVLTSDIQVSKIYAVNDLTERDLKDERLLLAAVSKRLVSTIVNHDETAGPDDTLALTAEGAPEGASLDCDIKEYVKPDGRVVFEVSNKPKDSDTDKSTYTLQVTFNARISTSRARYQQESGGTQTAMEKVTTTLTWSLDAIKKGVA